MSTAIKLSEVAMSFDMAANHQNGSHVVFDGLNLEIARGERVGLIGRNGAGKSTLLRIIAGIFPPVSGRVWRDPALTISLLSLGLGFKADLTGRENAFLSAVLQGFSRREAKKRLDEIGEFTELGDFYDEPVAKYSTGMRGRLGFATAMLLDTDILLIDEILAVGDQAFREKSGQALNARMGQGRTLVVVHHSPPIIRELCTRAIWLENGSVQMEGDVDPVLRAYAAG